MSLIESIYNIAKLLECNKCKKELTKNYTHGDCGHRVCTICTNDQDEKKYCSICDSPGVLKDITDMEDYENITELAIRIQLKLESDRWYNDKRVLENRKRSRSPEDDQEGPSDAENWKCEICGYHENPTYQLSCNICYRSKGTELAAVDSGSDQQDSQSTQEVPASQGSQNDSVAEEETDAPGKDAKPLHLSSNGLSDDEA